MRLIRRLRRQPALALQRLILRLQQGEDPEVLKASLARLLQNTAPKDLIALQTDLVRGGASRSGLLQYCGLQLELLQDAFDAA